MSKKFFETGKARRGLFFSVLGVIGLSVLVCIWVVAWQAAAYITIFGAGLGLIYLGACFWNWVEWGEWEWDIW